jgi:hypothetical protein
VALINLTYHLPAGLAAQPALGSACPRCLCDCCSLWRVGLCHLHAGLCSTARGTPSPTVPIQTVPTTAPPDTLIEGSPQVAGLQDSIKLAAIVKLLENKDENPQAISTFTEQSGFVKRYPLGFALFYSDGRKILYYGRQTISRITFDPSSLKVTRVGDGYCMNILPIRVQGKLLDNIKNMCVAHFTHVAQIGDVLLDIEPLATSSEGAAWVVGASPVKSAN